MVILQIEKLEQDMSSSDIILVSDGEIPNPPVSNVMMAKLESLRQQTGMEIQGLLIGKKDSPALLSLCDSVHDFLVGYEMKLLNRLEAAAVHSPTKSTASALYAKPLLPRSSYFSSGWRRRKLLNPRQNLPLYASLHDIGDGYLSETNLPFEGDSCRLLRKKDIKSGKKHKGFVEDDEDWEWGFEDDGAKYASDSLEPSVKQDETGTNTNSDFVRRLDDAYDSVRKKALQELKSNKWSRDELDLEIERSTLHSKRQVLSDSVSFIESGLVERETESRLIGKPSCTTATALFSYKAITHLFV
jgi:hypothetical protein